MTIYAKPQDESIGLRLCAENYYLNSKNDAPKIENTRYPVTVGVYNVCASLLALLFTFRHCREIQHNSNNYYYTMYIINSEESVRIMVTFIGILAPVSVY